MDGRGEGLVIDDNVDVALESIIWTLGHDVDGDNRRATSGRVVIEDHVWIGCRSIISSAINQRAFLM